MRALFAATMLMQLVAQPAMAQLCALAPTLFAIEATADNLMRDPSPGNAAQLEQAIMTLEWQRATLGEGLHLTAVIERFISSRTSLALAMRTTGPAGLSQVANTAQFATTAGDMHMLVSESGCGVPSSAGRFGPPQAGGPDGVSFDAVEEAPTHTKAAPKTGRLATLAPNGIALAKHPASVFAMAVVATIFAALGYMTFRRKRRGYARFICFLPVDLVVGQSNTATHLIEMSQSGAKISITDPLDQGVCVALIIDGVRYDAKAVWANSSCAGLQFSTIISHQKLTELLGQNGGGYIREPLTA